MGTALEVKPEIAEKLRLLAEAQKLSVDELLTVYIPGLTPADVERNGRSAEDRIQAFDEWVKSFPTNTPPLSDEAISRESLYGNR